MIDIGISGIQQAQADNLRRIADLQPGGELGKSVQGAAVRVHAYVVDITHVDTGALRAAHRIDYAEQGAEAIAKIYIDPAAVNPKGQRPEVYGPYEHERGGHHAFYNRAVAEEGPSAIADSAQALAISLMS